ncbi:transcriptional adapter 1-like isoform X2 [Ptychodera flava]|uniref:transcriptional adapter 1-like isoform X2 n=1 Tax=Ptychodera flava TaxID=63121 RepID=UPI00396A9BCC
MAAVAELNAARKNLTEVLGDNIKQYWTNMKLWYRQKINKEEFDLEARRLLTPDYVHYHNEFILAILTKCQTLGSQVVVGKESSMISNMSAGRNINKKVSKKFKKSRPAKTNFEHRFVPASPYPFINIPEVLPKEVPDDSPIAFCSRDLFLPDISMLHGRMFVTAWECGLEAITDDCVQLLQLAVEQHLKNILSVVLGRRHGFRLREGCFRYGIGNATKSEQLRKPSNEFTYSKESTCSTADLMHGQVPADRPTLEEGEHEAAMLLASNHPPPSLPPVSLYDLLEALQVHKSTIPSHTVYAINMERLLSKLWHPSHEQLEQDEIHRQEVILKEEFQNQQRCLRV